MKRNDTVVVRSKFIACQLRDMGFKLLGVKANRRYPAQDVYIFKSTPKLEEELSKMIKEQEEFMKRKKNKKKE